MVRQLHLLARLLVVVFVCIILTGCSDAGATIAKRWQSDIEELCATLESITDAKSCEDALPKVEKIVKDIHAASAEYKKLNLTTEAARELDEKYSNTKNSERLQKAVAKLSSMEASNTELKAQVDHLLEILQKANVTPEPAKTAQAPEKK
jgi:hypothetical protein